jgi:hypothetical protein
MSLHSSTGWSKVVGRGLWSLTRRLRKRRPLRARFRLTVDLLECRALLSTLTVTNTNDSGTGSLRDAIATANSQSGSAKIVFAPKVSGTIDLSSGPLTITNNLEIDGPGAGQLAVSGQGASRVFVIDGGSYGAASQVTIKGLTIEDGLATSDLAFPPSGGGILDLMASLTLRDSVLDSNQAPLGGAGAMIYRGSLNDSGSTWANNVILGNASSTTVGSDTLDYNGSGVDVFASVATSDNTTFTSNIYLSAVVDTAGGGISAEEGSTLSVSGGTFNGNQAGDGGGISAEEGSTLSVSGGTFDGNQSGDGGGAILAGDNTNVTVVNSSFTNNIASFGGGAVAVVQLVETSTTPQLIVQSSTFVGNQAGYEGGGIQTLGATAKISGSVFTANQATGTFLLALSQGGAISATPSYSNPPYPSNQSIPLAVTKCTFIDNQASVPEFDFSAVGQGGAIWNQIAMTVTGGTFSDNSAEGPTAQGGAIADDEGSAVTIDHASFVGNQAVGQYNGASGGAIYTALQPAPYPSPPTTTNITGSSFIDNLATGWGEKAGGAIADSPYGPVFPGSALTITGTTFIGNQAVGSPTASFPFVMGGAIYSPVRPLSIISSSFLDNQAIGISPPAALGMPGGQAFGGAIQASGPSVTIDRSNFQGNIVQGGSSDFGGGAAAGGALELGLFGYPVADVSNSTFSGNLAENGFGGVGYYPLAAAGGAIAGLSGSLNLSNLNVEDNEAFGGDGPAGSAANGANGGGIFNLYGSTMTLTNCSISGNLALGGQGGDAPLSGGPAGNGANGEGGGIFNSGTLTMSGSKVSANLAIGGAGGANLGGTAGNGGNGYGGGILATAYSNYPGSGSVSVDDCIVTGNQAIGGAGGAGATNGADGEGLGGGIAILDGSSVTIQKTTVRGNFASTADNNIYPAPPGP